jgi:hypothetical protein
MIFRRHLDTPQPLQRLRYRLTLQSAAFSADFSQFCLKLRFLIIQPRHPPAIGLNYSTSETGQPSAQHNTIAGLIHARAIKRK